MSSYQMAAQRGGRGKVQRQTSFGGRRGSHSERLDSPDLAPRPHTSSPPLRPAASSPDHIRGMSAFAVSKEVVPKAALAPSLAARSVSQDKAAASSLLRL